MEGGALDIKFQLVESGQVYAWRKGSGVWVCLGIKSLSLLNKTFFCKRELSRDIYKWQIWGGRIEMEML